MGRRKYHNFNQQTTTDLGGKKLSKQSYIFRGVDCWFYIFVFLCCPRGNDTMMNLSSAVLLFLLFLFSFACLLFVISTSFLFKINFWHNSILNPHVSHTFLLLPEYREQLSRFFVVVVEYDVDLASMGIMWVLVHDEDFLHSGVGCVSTSVVLYAYIYRYWCFSNILMSCVCVLQQGKYEIENKWKANIIC